MEENQTDERPLSFSLDHFANWQELVTSGAISTSRTRTRRGLAPQKPKAKRRKNQDLAGDCGERVVRSDGRKDRHSKVCTAKGTRDRRVRLSPETAIMFYDVQDRLGCDRPSKAIDWLMREAKAAIDALDNDPPPLPPADCDRFASADFMGSCSGVPVNHEIQQIGPENNAGLSNNGGFGFIADEYQQGFSPLAPLTASSDGIFEANLELGKMQRIFAWNYGNGSLPDHFTGAAPSVSGRGQISREPLQSSYSRIADCNNPVGPRFPSFDFSDDPLPDFTTAEENEMGNLYKIPVSGEQSSSASFLHYEG